MVQKTVTEQRLTEEQRIRLTNWRRKVRLHSEKVYGVPRLPHKIDAMYDNVCRGNLMAYYLDANPARSDKAYLKLESLLNPEHISMKSQGAYEKVARYYQDSLMARQMNEETYKKILSTPEGRLKLDFCLLYSGNKELRERIAQEEEYMYRTDKKEWVEVK